MPEPIFMKPSIYIMAAKPFSVVFSINPSNHSVFQDTQTMSMFYRCKTTLRIVFFTSVPGNCPEIRSRNKENTIIDELLDTPLLCGQCLMKGESLGLYVYPLIVAS